MPQENEHNAARRTQPGRRAAPSAQGAGRAQGPEGRSGAGEGRQAPPRRRRRRRRMGPLGALLYVVAVIGISVLLACLGWTWAGDVLALNKEPLTATVVVAEGDTISDVADTLKEEGLIEYKPIFNIFASLTHTKVGGEKGDVAPGTYELNTDMDYRALISSMGKNSSSRVETTLTITEGMTLDQIFKAMEDAGICSVEELRDVAANHEFKYSFLRDLPTGDYRRLEGYLFPDTYQFYLDGDPLQTLNKMILRFDEMFTEDMRTAATESGMTIGDVVKIASMVEKETDGDDQRHISSVIYNRLHNPAEGGTYGYLNIDATILYATGGTAVNTAADTPYNTYTHTGLPPTAISNPGIVALRAAVYPDSTKDYYYALGDDGVHHFFTTYEKQQAFIATQEIYKNGSNK